MIMFKRYNIYKIIIVYAYLITPFFCIEAQILPFPNSYSNYSDTLKIKNIVRISGHTPNNYIKNILEQDIFKGIKVTYTASHGNISFQNDNLLPAEAYNIDINNKGIIIKSSSLNGYIYAIQSLRQIVIHSSPNTRSFQFTTIKDEPRCKYRSFMLDSGRQYQKIETIKKYIDLMSLLKMNYFHWHLTEGLGWRIEIKRYPKLTSIGSNVARGKEQQGYYSQAEVKELIIYAKERGITIIPEIDIPGHSEAALASYPSLGCTEDSIIIPENGFTDQLFCAGKDSTLFFLKNVFLEICNLFPSQYIHIGGDEAPKGKWNKCSLCQSKIQALGLKDSNQLQLWLMTQIAEYLKTQGKYAICWEDVIHHDFTKELPNNLIIHWWNWRGHKDEAFNKACTLGIPVICGTNYYTYLNFPDKPWKGYAQDRTSSVYDVYYRNESLPRLSHKNTLGMSCCLWTDYGLTEDLLDQRLFPKIFILANQMWSNSTITLNDFLTVLIKKKKFYSPLGYTYTINRYSKSDFNKSTTP